MKLRKKDIPNYLTYFRIAVIPALIIVFLLTDHIGKIGYTLSALLFALAGITDWLDGYAARIWQAQSNIGRFLDPIADKLLVATALLLMVSVGRADILYAGRFSFRDSGSIWQKYVSAFRSPNWPNSRQQRKWPLFSCFYMVMGLHIGFLLNFLGKYSCG
jgi:phosphatidylglycerophosphate synthase